MISKPDMVELFSGQKTISNYFESHGFFVQSVDINSKLNPSICCDIMKLDICQLPDKPLFLWASPDCTLFSRCNHSQDWNKETIKYRKCQYIPKNDRSAAALKLVEKTFNIIKLIQPVYWVVENPVGRFRHLDIVRSFVPYRYSVNYKDFGFDYSKETDLFTNFMLPFSTSVPLRIGKSVSSIHGSKNRSSVPVNLVEFLFDYLCFQKFCQ